MTGDSLRLENTGLIAEDNRERGDREQCGWYRLCA